MADSSASGKMDNVKLPSPLPRISLDNAVGTWCRVSKSLEQSVAKVSGRISSLHYKNSKDAIKQKEQKALVSFGSVPALFRRNVGQLIGSWKAAGEQVQKVFESGKQQSSLLFREVMLNSLQRILAFKRLLNSDDVVFFLGQSRMFHASRAARLPLASISTGVHSTHDSASGDGIQGPKHLFDLALAVEQVSKAINGVPVYTVSNSSNEFVLVSDLDSNKSLGVFCFRQVDAEALLAQVKDREPSLGRGARVVEVMLDKVYRLNAEGIAFRLLPDPLQVKNAIVERSRRGDTSKGFSGVPVFQSDNLILKIKNRRCCPVFFSKEDLENALRKAFMQQKRSNPTLQAKTEIQVGSFEDVLKRMEDSSEDSGWGDIVFVPPGMDARHHLDKAVAAGVGGGTVIAQAEDDRRESKPPTVIC